jgi:L-threonylcarbamoyladenylate synthase
MWVDSYGSESAVIERAAEVVRAGGVILYPSDTIYGLGCDPFCRSAVQRIFDVKQRPKEKGLLVLVPNTGWLERFACEVDSELLEFCEYLWPGPLTIVLNANRELNRELTGGERKIGIRWPDDPYLQEWMEKIPGPVVSTSANLSGGGVITSVKELQQLFEAKVDLFIQSKQPLEGTASTVVDFTCTPPKILRRGVHGQKVESYLASRFGPTG